VSAALFLEEGNQEYNGEDYAECSHHYVANSQEVVLSTEGVGCGENEAFLAVEGLNIVLIFDTHVVGAWFQSSLDFTPELSEVRETCSSHPHNKVLYNHC
jgi:hypothetical protein